MCFPRAIDFNCIAKECLCYFLNPKPICISDTSPLLNSYSEHYFQVFGPKVNHHIFTRERCLSTSCL